MISQAALSSSTISRENEGGDLSVAILDLDPEFRAAVDVTHREAATHVLFDDVFRHEKAHTGTFSQLLGGEVGVEYPVQNFLFDPSRVVGHGHDRRKKRRKRWKY